MKMKIKIMNEDGARPNFMKIAPIIFEMMNHLDFEPKLLHTGQHYDDAMSKFFFEDCGFGSTCIERIKKYKRSRSFHQEMDS